MQEAGLPGLLFSEHSARGFGVGGGVGCGVAVGVGVWVGVVWGVAVGIVTGVGVGVSVGVGVELLTVNHKLILELLFTFEISGGFNGGIKSPPESIETVPVGEIIITLEFSGVSIMAIWQLLPLQIVKVGFTEPPSEFDVI